MSSKSRSKLLALSLVGVVVIAWLLEGTASWQSPWDARSAKISALRNELQEQSNLLLRRDRQSRELQRWAKMSLPWDEAKAAAIYYPYLTKLTETCGLTQVALTPTSGGPEAHGVGAMRLSVTAEAGVDAWDRFFQAVRSTPALQQILRWDLQAGGDGTIRGSVVLEAVRYTEDGTNDNGFVLPEELASTTAFGERNWFGDQNSIAAVEPTPVETSSDDSGEQSQAPSFTLIGIYGSPQDGEAWLYDAQSQSRIVLRRNRTFEVGRHRGSVAEVNVDGVTIDFAGRKQSLRLGDRLQ